jgi:L-cysteine:1D-myo-inositol 2-amino-2-deoxy-alpha-D-glucopyranoside ligase
MSQSLGNLVFVGDLCKESDPAAVRLALLGHHYRTDWELADGPGYARGGGPAGALWRSALDGPSTEGLAAVRAALDDDLETPTAQRALDSEAAAGRPVAAGASLLGVEL